MTDEARAALLDVIDRAWTHPSAAQVQVLFRFRAHADVTVFTHEQQAGGKVSEADARTLLVALGAERGYLYSHTTTDETTGVMDYVAHRDSGSRVKVAVQYEIKQPALT